MKMRASAELSCISHYANRFPGLNKTTNFFKDYRTMFVKGNDVAGMLNRDHVTCFSCKAGKNNYASQRGLNALVLFTGDINAVMPGTDIKMLGHHSPHRSEKSMVSDGGLFPRDRISTQFEAVPAFNVCPEG